MNVKKLHFMYKKKKETFQFSFFKQYEYYKFLCTRTYIKFVYFLQ